MEESWIVVLMMMILISSGSGGVDAANPDVEALLAFKNNLNANDAFVSWTGSSPCEWHGVNCTDGVLKTLVLSVSGLEGTLSPRLGDLKSLEVLELSGNKLNGTIPREIGDMTSLVGLALSHNSLTGVPPQELNKLSRLEELLLNNNPFEGCFSTSAWRDLMTHVTPDFSNIPNLNVTLNC